MPRLAMHIITKPANNGILLPNLLIVYCAVTVKSITLRIAIKKVRSSAIASVVAPVKIKVEYCTIALNPQN